MEKAIFTLSDVGHYGDRRRCLKNTLENMAGALEVSGEGRLLASEILDDGDLPDWERALAFVQSYTDDGLEWTITPNDNLVLSEIEE